MWTRIELKEKAKVALKGNYWKAVLVGVLLLFAAGGMGSSVSGSPSAAIPGLSLSDNNDSSVVYDNDYYYDYDYDDYYYFDDEYYDEYFNDLDSYDVDSGSDLPLIAVVLTGLGLLVVFLAVFAVILAIDILIANPLLVGIRRFFLRSLNQKADVKEVTYAFDNGNYVELIKTMFLRDLFTVLWSLLFVVPGIVKSYEYRMIPYLLAEDPYMTKDQAFAESKRMMTGQKWNAFVLDLSFLGWNILSACTLGILGVFYVGPYQALANAALYEKLRYGLPAPTDSHYAPTGKAPVAPANAAPVPPIYAAPVQPVAGAARQAAPVVPQGAPIATYANSVMPTEAPVAPLTAPAAAQEAPTASSVNPAASSDVPIAPYANPIAAAPDAASGVFEMLDDTPMSPMASCDATVEDDPAVADAPADDGAVAGDCGQA